MVLDLMLDVLTLDVLMLDQLIRTLARGRNGRIDGRKLRLHSMYFQAA